MITIADLAEAQRSLPESGYIRQARLLRYVLPISHATLWRWVAAGKFPKPVKLGARVTAWRVEDVHRWQKTRVV